MLRNGICVKCLRKETNRIFSKKRNFFFVSLKDWRNYWKKKTNCLSNCSSKGEVQWQLNNHENDEIKLSPENSPSEWKTMENYDEQKNILFYKKFLEVSWSISCLWMKLKMEYFCLFALHQIDKWKTMIIVILVSSHLENTDRGENVSTPLSRLLKENSYSWAPVKETTLFCFKNIFLKKQNKNVPLLGITFL